MPYWEKLSTSSYPSTWAGQKEETAEVKTVTTVTQPLLDSFREKFSTMQLAIENVNRAN